MLNPQMKRGLLEVCVLSALSREGSYGYKIIRDVSDCIEISESTLYPILKRLESSGMVTAHSVEHNGRPCGFGNGTYNCRHYGGSLIQRNISKRSLGNGIL